MQDFLILLSLHFLSDFPLQGEWMAREKYDAFKTQLGTIALFAHACIQAFMLGLGGYILGYDFLIIFSLIGITHFVIDLGKIKGYYGVLTDQMLHYIQILWLIILF